MIEFKDVTKIYEDNGAIALENISLKISEGDFVFVVGFSGSGKSTFIRLLLREEIATSGEIFISGDNIRNLRNSQVPFLRRKIGVVFQDFRLLPKKTVYENVAFAMQITETPHREIRRSVNMALSMVGLHNKAKMLPKQLSGGEQQRVAIARAIVNKPPILLADEPTGNLDPDMSWDIMSLLEDINARGTTVVVATHAWDIVDVMQKRVIRFDKGKLTRDVVEGGYDDEA